MKALFLSLFLSGVVFSSGFGQTSSSAPAKNKANYTLQQQFNSLKFRSSPYKEFGQNYRAVKESGLEALLKSVQDTLRVREQSIRNAGKETAVALANTQKELDAQKAQVQALQQDNAQKEAQIQQTEHDVASLSVLGLDLDKQVYVMVSLVIILGLGAVAGVFAYLYKNSNSVAQEKVRAYEEISEELKTQKQSAREKELKLKREQQSEANKVEDLKQEIAELQKKVTV